jgi:hypothetical protein
MPKVFDVEKKGLPSFIEEERPQTEQPTNLDLLIDLPTIVEKQEEEQKNLSTVNNIFIMKNKKIQNKPIPLREPTDTIISEEVGITPIVDNTSDVVNFKKKEKYENIGKRGRDKKPRKKRIMSETQKEKLAEARKKSLEVRRMKAAEKYQKMKAQKEQKKSEPIPIPKKEVINPIGNFDQFCDFMERYEQRKMKSHIISQDPHPNKIIPEQQKPRPPIQKRQQPPRYIEQRPPQKAIKQQINIPKPQPIKEKQSLFEQFNTHRTSNNRSLFQSGFGRHY